MKTKQRCNRPRVKPSAYLSNRNIRGETQQKCGRVAVGAGQFGDPRCRTCLDEETPKQEGGL